MIAAEIEGREQLIGEFLSGFPVVGGRNPSLVDQVGRAACEETSNDTIELARCALVRCVHQLVE